MRVVSAHTALVCPLPLPITRRMGIHDAVAKSDINEVGRLWDEQPALAPESRIELGGKAPRGVES